MIDRKYKLSLTRQTKALGISRGSLYYKPRPMSDADLVLMRRIDISMDGKGAWCDNVFVARLWRTIKYEEVYLHAYENVPQARAGIKKYLTFYNNKRPHSSLDRPPLPDQVYFNQPQPIPVAA